MLPWTFGLWAAIRFLRNGRLPWLLAAIGCGVVAYFTRPEGLLLAFASSATLLALPLFRADRLARRGCRLIACVVIGVLVLAGPYIALRGGLGTKPGIARVLALAPQSNPLALEREKPLPPTQPLLHTYRLAIDPDAQGPARRGDARSHSRSPCSDCCYWPCGKQCRERRSSWRSCWPRRPSRSCVCMPRGDTARPATDPVPGILLTIAAAGALAWLGTKIAHSRPMARAGKETAWGSPQPVGSAAGRVVLLAVNRRAARNSRNAGPFRGLLRDGRLARRNVKAAETGARYDRLVALSSAGDRDTTSPTCYQAPADPATRWVVVREPHVEGRWHYTPGHSAS